MSEARSQQRSDSPKASGGVFGSAKKQAAAAQKPFAVFDIDGTLIRWQLYHAITDALARRGHLAPETYQSIRDSRMAWKRRTGGSFKDYEKQVVYIYEQMLTTLSPDQFAEAADAVFGEYKDQVYVYTRDLIKQLKSQGYLLFAISGSQNEIVARIASYYGFDDYVGTIYERAGEKFTGNKTVGSFNKDKSLTGLVKKHGASNSGSVAVGDSHSDAAILAMVERPIAFNPELELYNLAVAKGWKIVIERKNIVYELENSDGQYVLAKTKS